MGSSASSKVKKPVLDPSTHDLASTQTGTLIYNFHKNNLSKQKSIAAETDTKVADEEHTYYGLDVPFVAIELNEKIGQGTYGKVFKAKYINKPIAVKQLYLSDDPDEREEILDDFAKEIRILSILSHPKIVKFYGACRQDPSYCLLFELCEGSVASLLNTVHKKQVSVTWRMCIQIAKDCAEAVNYLHNLNPKILHRDLKAENLLLDEHFHCKLTDFGLSRRYDEKSVMTVCGTPCAVAPEIFLGEPYTHTVDSYSYGICLWELFYFQKPYKDEDSIELPYRVATKGLRPPPLSHCPDSLNDLMRDCWHVDKDSRPDFAEIMEKLDEIEKEVTSYITEPIDLEKMKSTYSFREVSPQDD